MDVVNNSEASVNAETEREGVGERLRDCQSMQECKKRTIDGGKKIKTKCKSESEVGSWYLERRRRQSGRLATTSYCCVVWDSRRKNSSYVSVQCHFCSAKFGMSTALPIQRKPCLSMTDSCVKLLLTSVYVTELSNLHSYRLFLLDLSSQVRDPKAAGP